MTETRGAWIAAIVGILVVGAVLDRKLLLGALVVPVLLIAFVPPVTERVTSVAARPGGRPDRELADLAFRALGRGVADGAGVPGHRASGSMRRCAAPARNRTTTSCSSWSRWAWPVSPSTSGSWVRPSSPASARPDGSSTHGCPSSPSSTAVTVALFGYAVAFIVASAGENLLENVTTLWVVLPALAAVSWVAQAPRLGLVRARRTPGALRARLSQRWTAL